MKNLYKILTLVIVCLLSQSCNDYPVDDNGLLVTDSEECYISSLDDYRKLQCTGGVG